MAIGISMIMLTSDTPIRADDMQRCLAEHWPDLPEATEIEEKDGTVSLQLGDASVIMAKMPAPTWTLFYTTSRAFSI